mgnify:CR=1 FL=1
MKVTLIEGFLLINYFSTLQPLQVVAHKKMIRPEGELPCSKSERKVITEKKYSQTYSPDKK